MTDKRTPRTCGQCRYRIERECRCCPPQVIPSTYRWIHTEHGGVQLEGYLTRYPHVTHDNPACAMWQHDRRGNQPEETNHEK